MNTYISLKKYQQLEKHLINTYGQLVANYILSLSDIEINCLHNSEYENLGDCDCD